MQNFDEIFTVRNIRKIRQQGAAPRVGFEIHDLALCRLSFACAAASYRPPRSSPSALEDRPRALARRTACARSRRRRRCAVTQILSGQEFHVAGEDLDFFWCVTIHSELLAAFRFGLFSNIYYDLQWDPKAINQSPPSRHRPINQ